MRSLVKRSSSLVLALAVMGAGAFLLPGCSNDDTSSMVAVPLVGGPSDGPVFVHNPTSDDVASLGGNGRGRGRGRGSPQVPDASSNVTSVSANVGNPGAELELRGLKVEIPQGALKGKVEVTLTLLDPERIHFRVDPPDLELKEAIKFTMSTHRKDTDGLSYYGMSFFSKEGTAWAPLPTSTDDKRARAASATAGEFCLAGTGAGGQMIQFVRWLRGPGYMSELATVVDGAVIQLSRYLVKIPAFALSEDTYITIRDSGGEIVECQLEPHGLQFNLPVELKIRLNDLNPDDYTDWSIFWLNEETERWEDQHGSFDSSQQTVWVELEHFSRYRPGRGGW